MDCCKPFSEMDEDFLERLKLFKEREGQFMVVLREEEKVIGTVNVFEHEGRAVAAMELGYSISPEYQRKGYATEALSAMIDFLQEKLQLRLLVAGVLEENEASHGLLKKLGFEKEGMRYLAAWHEGLEKPVSLIYYYHDRDK